LAARMIMRQRAVFFNRRPNVAEYPRSSGRSLKEAAERTP
jgi:hypothetical protein